MTVEQLIVQLSKYPPGTQVKADSMSGPFLVAEGESASALVDLNLGLEAESSDESVDLAPMTFKVTGLVPRQFEGEPECVLELTFEVLG